MPTAAISATRGARIGRLLGAHRVSDLDRAVDDLIPQRLHLGDGVGIVGDEALRALYVGIERGHRHAALLEAERGNRRLGAGDDSLDGELDGYVRLLLHIVHDGAWRLRALVHVDAERGYALGVLHGLEDAAVRTGAGGEDAVGAVGDHRRATLLAARRIGKRVVAADPERRRYLDVGFDVLRALDKAVRVAVQEGDIERADRSDLAGLGRQRRLRPGQKG